MKKESKRFLWGILAIVIIFFSIQNTDAVKAGLAKLVDLVLPLIYGCAIAFILNLIVRFLEKYLTFGPFKNRTFRRVVTIILSLVILVAVVTGLVAGLVPEIKSSVTMLVDRLPDMINNAKSFAVDTLQLPAEWFAFIETPDVAGIVETLFQNGIIQQVVQSGGSIVGGAVTTVTDILLGLCFAIYLLFQKEVLIAGAKRLVRAYMKPAAGDRLIYIASSMNEIYSSFISGQCLDAAILGTMVTVTLALFGIDYSLLIGIVIAFTALVPVVGAFLGGVVGVFLLLMISFKDALIFLIALLVLQQIDNRLIYPHVVGNAVGLPAIWIFAAIIVGGNLGGIFGMILAIPLFALAYSLIGEDLHKREEKPETEDAVCEE